MSRYIPQYFPIYEIPSTETTNASPFTHAFLVKDAGDGPYAARYPSSSRAVWFWQIPAISPAPADICRGRSVLPAGASQCPDAVNGQAGCWFLHLPRFLRSAARGPLPPPFALHSMVKVRQARSTGAALPSPGAKCPQCTARRGIPFSMRTLSLLNRQGLRRKDPSEAQAFPDCGFLCGQAKDRQMNFPLSHEHNRLYS